jgi:hypothetical protein
MLYPKAMVLSLSRQGDVDSIPEKRIFYQEIFCSPSRFGALARAFRSISAGAISTMGSDHYAKGESMPRGSSSFPRETGGNTPYGSHQSMNPQTRVANDRRHRSDSPPVPTPAQVFSNLQIVCEADIVFDIASIAALSNPRNSV